MSGLLLKFGVGCIGGTIFAATAYLTAISYAPAPTYTVTDTERARKFEQIAPTYLSQTRNQEFYLGIRKMRRALAREARGDVLEIGAGTGTMVGLYPASEAAEVIFREFAEREKQIDENSSSSSAMIVLNENQQTQQDESKTSAKNSSNNNKKLRNPNAAPHNPLEQKLIQDSIQMSSEQSKTSSSGGGGGGVRSVTMSDRASKMMQQLEEKIESRIGYTPHRLLDDEISLWLPGTVWKPNTNSQNVNQQQQKLPAGATASGKEKHPLYQTAHFSSEDIPFPDNSFDTVVDIFGLCSYDDPVKALMEMSRVCKPDGDLLLLEHGRGNWSRVNIQLDKWAPRHARSWGCWWNRDMKRYLRLAGLTKVTSRQVKHFGTTHKLSVKPNKKWMVENTKPAAAAAAASAGGGGAASSAVAV